MASGEDDSQKTEDPSARKLSKAFEEGNVAKSQEVTAWFMLAAGLVFVGLLAGPYAFRLGEAMFIFIERPHLFALDAAAAENLALKTAVIFAAAVIVPGVIMMLAALAGNLVQNPPTFSMRTIEPKLDKLDPVKGLSRLFGMQGWINLAKALAKLVIIGGALALVFWADRDRFAAFIYKAPQELLPIILYLTIKVMATVVAIMAVIALADLIYQRFHHHQQLRMSKQEVKDEHKELEGDPQIKAKIRQVRAEKAKRRMMQAVPSATVIVTNPTHYSVALKYEDGVTSAPVVVAKGVDDLALRIRLIAKEHKIPLVENPPLARALHATVEVDEMVPPEHFKAVAEVIGFVLRHRAPKRPRPTRRS